MNRRNTKQNENLNHRQNRSAYRYNDSYYSNNRRNPHMQKQHPGGVSETKGLPVLIMLLCLLAAVIVLYIILNINFFSYSAEISDVLTASGSGSAEVIEDIKVDDSHYVYVFKDGTELSASYIKIKGSGENKKYKCLKRCDPLNLETYKKDMQDKDMDFSSKGDFCFSLDFSGSSQYDQFIKYFEDNNISEDVYSACPINVEGINQIFIVWMWKE